MAKKKLTTKPADPIPETPTPAPAPTPAVSRILSPEDMEILNDVAAATTLLQKTQNELDILMQKKLTIGAEIETEVNQRIKQVLELSAEAVLKIKANGREVVSIKNSIKDMFEKVLAFADDVLKSSQEVEKYRKNILTDLDKLILQVQEEQIRVNDQKKTIKEQWDDVARVRKDQDSREKLIYSRRAALESAIAEFGFKEADIQRRIKSKKGKK